MPGNIAAAVSGSSETRRPLFGLGYSRSSAAARLSRFARACASVAPVFKRPAPVNVAAPRSCNQSPAPSGATSAAIIIGTHRSGPKIDVTPLNPSGATPTTVNTRRFSAMVRPTTARSPPKRRCQNP